ncbi:hypothetical protein M8C21_026863 [Ambrosia artemisiifolia]|uniref:Uncharacterized protein n=1 Tax=Ambrosia artemisiifolia TaxID=4212 RepID=A0AAD5CSE2_AMBAR|nr:hypothetical protein M8C21_026863 [Ambrosia artemisiifolia]
MLHWNKSISLISKSATSRFRARTSSRLQGFRSNAALESLTKAREERTQNVVLYNYPSFSGAFSALFSHLFHRHLNLPCLILPFSSVEPFRVEDLCIDGLEKCYFLDFLGPKGFAAELSRRTSCQVIGFDHRKTTLSDIHLYENGNSNLSLKVNLEKNSSAAAYDYFCAKLSEMKRDNGVRIDGNSNLSDIVAKELSMKSKAAGLRPIGAVIYLQGKNLKMCLRSSDSCTDTSAIAKAYGGGGTPSSSSFIIRMDEYNQWISGTFSQGN